jgi:acyl-homoserine lactone acylase PvdQ
MDGLVQSWVRTKAKGFDDYKKAMDLKANASNNTVYADSEGNIATGMVTLFLKEIKAKLVESG